ncbi:hypothetical protein [Priestia megaterium]|uniref:hypothetical protein n=1 Tax=Priestia megaterium TaxID=1404 RepID=UPI000CA29138|nr:hypothetical protein [Priestia megaterium]AUO14800.1 hypothetical protein C0569_26315 [Priestia megaterium]
MGTEIKLKVKQEVEGEMVTKGVTYEIEKLNFFKFIDVTKLINEIMKIAKDDEELITVAKTMFIGQAPSDEEKTKEERDLEFAGKLTSSFETLAYKLPDKAFELLAILSDIEKPVLGKQDFFTVMDVYEAVIAENDIQKLVDRVKKSSELTKQAFKLKALVTDVTK